MSIARLSLRYAIYFILSAIALQVVFFIVMLIKPGAIKIGYEIAAILPAAYLLGRAEKTETAKLAAPLIATLSLLLFGAQMWLQTALAGITLGLDRSPAASFVFLAGLIWGVALLMGWMAFRWGQKVQAG